jgi:hypothetical protein
MGPTYFWPQWQALRELGAAFGLEADAVNRGLAAMLHGAVDQYFQAGMDYERVMDTIPVKPLAEDPDRLLSIYRERLPVLHQRLTAARVWPD